MSFVCACSLTHHQGDFSTRTACPHLERKKWHAIFVWIGQRHYKTYYSNERSQCSHYVMGEIQNCTFAVTAWCNLPPTCSYCHLCWKMEWVKCLSIIWLFVLQYFFNTLSFCINSLIKMSPSDDDPCMVCSAAFLTDYVVTEGVVFPLCALVGWWMASLYAACRETVPNSTQNARYVCYDKKQRIQCAIWI